MASPVLPDPLIQMSSTETPGIGSVRLLFKVMKRLAELRLYRRLRGSTTAVLLALLVLLPGCLFSRALSLQTQFCDLESNFRIIPGDHIRLQFKHPVLMEQDVEWLTGATPTPIYDNDDELLVSYVIEKIMRIPDPDSDVELQLLYRRQEDAFKLAEIRFDEKLGLFIAPDVFESETVQLAALTVCGAGLGLAFSQIELPLTEEDIALLPNRTEVLEWFGPPSQTLEPGAVLAWEYRLKTNFPPQENSRAKKARVVVWFDPIDQRPLRLEASYWRYEVTADFTARTLLLKLDFNAGK